MLVISINSSSNIIQGNTKYTNVLGRQLLRAYRCFSCYRNRNYEDNPQSIILGSSLSLQNICTNIAREVRDYDNIYNVPVSWQSHWITAYNKHRKHKQPIEAQPHPGQVLLTLDQHGYFTLDHIGRLSLISSHSTTNQELQYSTKNNVGTIKAMLVLPSS